METRTPSFFFSSRRRHTSSLCDWSSDVCFFRSRPDAPGDGWGGAWQADSPSLDAGPARSRLWSTPSDPDGSRVISCVGSWRSGQLTRDCARTSRRPPEAPGRAVSDPVGPLHTSVFVAREADRPPGALSDRVTVSVVTVGELELAVLSTADSALRARRTDTLALARRM